ncbi:hypothetical protein [Streptomyces pactum]|uniref:hypothetical protein n=1 Tax=Streptomyces pactum TaxID=68249 RepID=UPI00227840BF|nr:hypothetical protein [Streptomyces pactum]
MTDGSWQAPARCWQVPAAPWQMTAEGWRVTDGSWQAPARCWQVPVRGHAGADGERRRARRSAAVGALADATSVRAALLPLVVLPAVGRLFLCGLREPAPLPTKPAVGTPAAGDADVR